MVIVCDIVLVVVYLYVQGIVYGDFYGYNILYWDGEVLFGDFGVVWFYDVQQLYVWGVQVMEVWVYGCLLEELLVYGQLEDEFGKKQCVVLVGVCQVCLSVDVVVWLYFEVIVVMFDNLLVG